MADWSDLPHELLRLIAQRLNTCFDLVHFKSVCSSWRSSAPPISRHESLRCPLPPDSDGCGDDCHLSRRRVYLLRSPPSGSLQDSSGGCWLFKIREEQDGTFVLQSPFCSHSNFAHPEPLYPSLVLDSLNCQITALGSEHMAYYTAWGFEAEMEVEGVVAFMRLGAGNDDFAVLGILSFQNLAMFRSADKQWTVLENTPNRFKAIASFNGKFFVVDRHGRTIMVKPSLEVSYFQNSRPPARARTLVQAGDELLLVELYSNNSEYEDWCMLDDEERKMWFEVFKLDEDKNEWDQVQDLGGRVLFLAHCSSFSCLASEIPGVSESSIFFMDRCGGCGGCSFDSILVFNLKDGSLRWIKDISGYRKLFWPPPSWIISNR